MDQDSFRQLLQAPRSSTSRNAPQTKGPSLPTQKPSEPKFKPRNVKKAESQYRDRAAERRAGGKSDYAQVEAVLEVFERRTANGDKDTVDEQRQYLGGDSEHTILVKGLDVSLLEQNKARAAASTEDDDTLEQAFLEASAPAAPNKRTREDIIRELKAKRSGEGSKTLNSASEPPKDDADKLENAKKAGKFKPIGFKQIGAQKDDKGDKKRIKKENTNRAKKKRKVGGVSGSSQPATATPHSQVEQPVEQQSSKAEGLAQRPPSPPNDDIDIFAGAGDYQGIIEDGDSDGDESDTVHRTKSEHGIDTLRPSSEHAPSAKGWFGQEQDDETSRQLSVPAERAAHQSPSLNPVPQVDEEEGGSLRLKPLETSALPSIRDFLAMDAAAEKEEKRRARREKKKNKKTSAGIDDDD